MAEELKGKVMTTDAGRPVGDNQNSLTVGDRGPIVFSAFGAGFHWGALVVRSEEPADSAS